MKKQYFAWEDGTNELAEITAKEFLTICKQNKVLAKSERRYFTRVPGVTEDDVYYFLECTYEDYKKSVVESQAKHRKLCEERDLKEKGLWYDIISLDHVYRDDSGNVSAMHDIVADDSAFFEEMIVTDIALESALGHLTDDERLVIDVLYLKNSDNMSEREIAEKMGIPQKTLNNRKLKILKKLKKYLAQN